MRKTYTEEFKKQAVELADNVGNVLTAARQLGIRDTLIHGWRKKITKNYPSKPSVDDLEEIKRLRKENAELKKVNYILKSAAAFFSQDHLK